MKKIYIYMYNIFIYIYLFLGLLFFWGGILGILFI